MQASFSGVTLSGGAKYASEKLAKTNAVTIMQKASRLRAPPLALPDVVPNLTDTAVRILSTQGEARFRDIYGTHFVVGWRLGGYLLFSFSFYSNEQVSTLDISGQLSVEVAGSGSGKASAAFSNSDKFSTVNIESKIKTNTRLPVTNCAGLGVTTEIPDNAAIKQCVLDWLEAEGGASAAYYAYAVPYIYHPTYAQVLEDLYGGNNATSAAAGAGRRLLREVGEIAGGRRALLQDAGAVVIDYKFKETGTLQSRINSIGNMLDTYKVRRACNGAGGVCVCVGGGQRGQAERGAERGQAGRVQRGQAERGAELRRAADAAVKEGRRRRLAGCSVSGAHPIGLPVSSPPLPSRRSPSPIITTNTKTHT